METDSSFAVLLHLLLLHLAVKRGEPLRSSINPLGSVVSLKVDKHQGAVHFLHSREPPSS
jgi:hypothetical protein